MNWIPGRPTERGYYWFQGEYSNYIVEVFTVVGEPRLQVQTIGYTNMRYLKEMPHVKKYCKIEEPH